MIPSRYYYLLSLTFVFIIPAIVAGIFVWQEIILVNFIVFVILITILGAVWNIWATRHGKKDVVWLWQFNFKDTLDVRFLYLPIEEYLFYVSSSLYIVFIWKAIEISLTTGNPIFFVLIPGMGLWSILFITIPYKFKMRSNNLKQFQHRPLSRA